MINTLVLCTGNSARSILLEAILGQRSEGRIRAFSAGSQPKGEPHPEALRCLAALGYDTGFARSKSWDEFGLPDAPQMGLVITVCDSAAGEVCPLWPGAPRKAHWGIDDPAAAPEPEQPAAFARAYEQLARRAEMLLGERFEEMEGAEFQALLTRIGALDDA